MIDVILIYLINLANLKLIWQYHVLITKLLMFIVLIIICNYKNLSSTEPRLQLVLCITHFPVFGTGWNTRLRNVNVKLSAVVLQYDHECAMMARMTSCFLINFLLEEK